MGVSKRCFLLVCRDFIILIVCFIVIFEVFVNFYIKKERMVFDMICLELLVNLIDKIIFGLMNLN